MQFNEQRLNSAETLEGLHLENDLEGKIQFVGVKGK